jgi:hypothetical protein
MAKISHTEIKQPSIGEKRPKLTYLSISEAYTNNRGLFGKGKLLGFRLVETVSVNIKAF